MSQKPKLSTEKVDEISILEISQGEVSFAVVGVMPLIMNRMAEKAKRELLLPRGPKGKAERAQSLKHDPVAEYRASVYRNYGDNPPTRLCLPAPAFKGAMMTAALRIPGSTKTEIGQLTWVVGERVNVWGIPELRMDVVRQAGMNAAPDIRTRGCLRRWASVITIRFVSPNLTQRSVVNLSGGGGIIAGVGDFRQEKGKGNYGQFRITDLEDAEFQEIVASGGREAQDAALEHYTCYDGETEELLEWYNEEILRRGREKQTAEETKVTRRGNGTRKSAADAGAVIQ